MTTKGLVRGPGWDSSQVGATRLVYCTSGLLLRSGLGAWCPPLAGQSTELVGGWGHQEGKDTVATGAGLPSGH